MADYSGYAFVTPAANQDWQIGFEYNKNTNAVIVEATSRTYATGFVTIKYTKTGDAPTRYHLPFLTANSDQGCIASASSEFNGGNQRAWNGFSGDMQTEWCTHRNGSGDGRCVWNPPWRYREWRHSPYLYNR